MENIHQRECKHSFTPTPPPPLTVPPSKPQAVITCPIFKGIMALLWLSWGEVIGLCSCPWAKEDLLLPAPSCLGCQSPTQDFMLSCSCFLVTGYVKGLISLYLFSKLTPENLWVIPFIKWHTLPSRVPDVVLTLGSLISTLGLLA